MTNKELIDLIANTWVSNGGDYTGFNYSWYRIYQRIKELINGESCSICEGVVMDSDDELLTVVEAERSEDEKISDNLC